jgi:outer membrane protein assembly factor BamB
VVSAPLVIDGLVVFFTGPGGAANLYAIEVQTGHQRWEVTVPDLPTSVAAHDGRVFVSSQGSTARSVDLATGESLWDAGMIGNVPLDLVVAHGGVYAGTREPVLFQLDPESGDIKYALNFNASSSSDVDSIAAGAEALFVMVGSRLVSLSPLTLAINWETNPSGYINGSTVVTVDDTVVYRCGSTLQALAASDRTEIWTLDGISMEELIIVDGQIFIPISNEL